MSAECCVVDAKDSGEQMRKFLILLPILLLVGCATIANPITTDRVTAIKQGYGIALSAAVAYRDACAARLIPPSCRTVVPQIVRANRKVEIALARLESLRRLGPTVDLTEAVNALSDAVNDLKVIVP